MTDPVDANLETVLATPADAVEQRGDLHALSPGDTIGRFAIISVLGAGGMGRVYRARDPDLDREIAIKVLRRATGDDLLQLRLKREAQAMARLNHPNLATVYDVGAVRGEVFIAFELVDGTTLARWMREPHRNFSERLTALIAAGRGLAAAHAAGVVHRDFKPDNVLVAHDSTVKVVDFGLARGVERGPQERPSLPELPTELTLTGSLIGTPAYMAPEQYAGATLDVRVDQFAFAVSAWECFYGERPFRGATIQELRDAICGGAITPPPQNELPPAIEIALRRAMSVEPEHRFTEMTDLLAAIHAAAQPRRRSWPIPVAIAASVAAVVTIVIVTRGENRAAPKRGVVPAGELSMDAIRTTVRAHKAQLAPCYEPVADRVGDGSVEIEFEVDAKGDVTSTRIVSDTFDGASGIARCIAKVSLDWKFPAPPRGVPVKVNYPFRLTRD